MISRRFITYLEIIFRNLLSEYHSKHCFIKFKYSKNKEKHYSFHKSFFPQYLPYLDISKKKNKKRENNKKNQTISIHTCFKCIILFIINGEKKNFFFVFIYILFCSFFFLYIISK